MTTKPTTLAGLKVEVSESHGYASVSAADTAKLVRHALALGFPGTKFSVKTQKYAGGATIHVEWTDGPGVSQVERQLRPYSGAGFDAMEDLKTHNEAWLFPDGSAVRFVTGIGRSWGATVTDATGVKLDPAETQDYMAGLHLAMTGSTTRRGYDDTSAAFKLGQADARSYTEAGAKLVSFHADYIQTHRKFSDAYRAELERAVVFLSGRAGGFDGNARYDFGIDGRVFAETGHTLVYQLSRLDDPSQITAALAEEAERRAIVAARLFNAQARSNQQARSETGPGVTGYYVTVKDGGRWAALLGPYDTRASAEADVPTGRKLAEAVNDRAVWYAYGVTKVTAKPGADLDPGKLEKLPARQMALAFGTETQA